MFLYLINKRKFIHINVLRLLGFTSVEKDPLIQKLGIIVLVKSEVKPRMSFTVVSLSGVPTIRVNRNMIFIVRDVGDKEKL